MKDGELIKQRRLALRLTQEQLGEMVGVSRTAIHRYETGNIAKMKSTTAEKLAKVLGVSPLEIMNLNFRKPTLEEIDIPIPVVPVPVYDPVSCGKGTWIAEEPQDVVAIPQSWARYGVEYFANPAEGDSMEPAIKDGNYLVFEKTEHIAIGEIGAFSVDGIYYCKRLKQLADGKFWLFSDNAKYDPIPISNDTDFRILGKLKFAISKI